MGFRFSSFVAGAAENLTETLKEDEKRAATAATFGVKALKEQYDKVQADNRSLETDLTKKVRFLEQSDPTATQAQLFAAATNDVYMTAVMEAAKANPGSFRVADVVKIKEANPSTQTAMEMIKAYTTIPAISQAARQAEGVAVPDKPQGLFGIGALRDRASSRAASKAEEQTAKAMGVSIDQLRAASGFKRPEIDSGATFDFTSMQKTKKFDERKNDAMVALLEAKQSGDADQITAATENMGHITVIEETSKTSNKTEAQIQSDLITEIQQKQAAGDTQGAATAQALLRQRQALAKAPGDGKTDADKITQSNLIQVATRTRVTMIEDTLPPGTFITSTDAQGNVTITLRDLSQGDLFRRGSAIAANSLIKEMTKPDGMPRSEMHKNAMMSAGVRFDEAGKAIKPPIPELPSKGGTPKPTPPQLTRQDQEALVWANTPANAGPKAEAIKKKIQNKINGVN